jgi:hypothetical protein
MMVETLWLVAIAHVWARGSLFDPVRTAGNGSAYWRAWRALADCPLCSGFWIGILGHAIFRAWPIVIETLGLGSLVGTLSLAVYGLIRRI